MQRLDALLVATDALERRMDALFHEEDHPRAEDGRFGTKSGGSGKAPEYKAGLHATGRQSAEALKLKWRESAPNTETALLESSIRNQGQLAAVCENVVATVNAKFANPGAKSPESLHRKLAGGREPAQVTDATRGGFDVVNPADGDMIIMELAKHFEIADEGWQKTPAGYFDRKTMVRFQDGQVGEIQMWPPGMFSAKETGGGHKLYEQMRTLPTDSTDAVRLREEMRALYAKVEGALPDTWKGLFGEDG